MTEALVSVDPRTGRRGDRLFGEHSPEQVYQVAGAAEAAFSELRSFPPMRFTRLLELAAKELERVRPQLIPTADEETALGSQRLESELARTCNQLRMFASLLREGSYLEPIIDTADPEPKSLRPDMRRMMVPIGPVAVFEASNFPFAFGVPGGDTASALAAGCPVVIKGHPSHPATSGLCFGALERAASAAGFPDGTISLVQGRNQEVGRALVLAPEIRAVGFTGSWAGGRALYDLAASRPEPIAVYAEMGSLNPVFIMPAALASRAAEIARGYVESMCMGAGQFCTKPGLVLLVHGAGADEFQRTAVDLVQARTAGHLLNSRITETLRGQLARTAVLPGVEVGVSGQAASMGFSVPPSLFITKATFLMTNPELQEEHFGPVGMIATCSSWQELIEVARDLPGSLTATVHGDEGDQAAAHELLTELQQKAGRLVWNGFPTGVAVGHATQHGGPYPATTSPQHTSVGTSAIRRFLRPVAWQGMPQELLPEALQDSNPRRLRRLIDGRWV